MGTVTHDMLEDLSTLVRRERPAPCYMQDEEGFIVAAYFPDTGEVHVAIPFVAHGFHLEKQSDWIWEARSRLTRGGIADAFEAAGFPIDWDSPLISLIRDPEVNAAVITHHAVATVGSMEEFDFALSRVTCLMDDLEDHEW